MKKINYYILCLSTLLLTSEFKSQVNSYVFSQFSSTYSAITGGTVYGNAASDDQVFIDPAVVLGTFSGANGVGLPIGFTFTYNNVPYDRLGISNNGYIFFGQSTLTPAVNSNISAQYQAISATSLANILQQQKVSALSADLAAQTGSTLRMEVIGSTPNQTCVIQWQNYSKWNNTGDNYNFQIRLHETTNFVEIVFGSFSNNATNLNAQLGLRGLTNADFNNRSVNIATGWSSSVPGALNNAVVQANGSGLVPASGQTYKWVQPTPCSGAPASNTVNALQAVICPNANTNLNLINTYTNTNLSYQWFSSTISAVGPFTPISNATLTTYPVTNLTVNTWYQSVITCSLTSNSTTSSATGVFVAPTTINNVPYFEGFEGLVTNNQLPNCSWSTSNPTVICQTYTTAAANNRIAHTGSKFASFKSGTNINGDYFYTNGIQLSAGVTYSAALWYITDGNLGWSNLSMHVGPNQSTLGLTAVASVSGAVTGQFYQLLSNTLTVPSSGVYYLAVKCIGNTTPQFLSFDNISLTLPCSLNSPTVTATAGNSLICVGNSLLLTASGADTYTWSTGATTNTINVLPTGNATYFVTGTNSLTGCSTGTNISLIVNPAATAYIFPVATNLCSGSSLTVNVLGPNTNSYLWSTGDTSPSIIVSPTITTTYTLLVSNPFGCQSTYTLPVTVKPLPQVTAQASNSVICIGETTTLSASGTSLVSYSWGSNNVSINGQQVFVSPLLNTTYSLSVTDVNGCSNTSSVGVTVLICTGIANNELLANAITILPNPNNGLFSVVTGTNSDKTITVMDATGKVVRHLISKEETVKIDLRELSSGVYYLKLNSSKLNTAVKVVKE